MKTVVIVLRSGGDFAFKDVELITAHINLKWKSDERPRIICIWDKASFTYDLGNIKIIPMSTQYQGTWSRIQLYSPEMDVYRPFLYVDLDTAIVQSLENIFDLIKDPTQYVMLEDFYQKDQLATGLVWFPKDDLRTVQVWNDWQRNPGPKGNRMDYYLRKIMTPDTYWQRLTDSIADFKPKRSPLLSVIPKNTNVVCFHGKPRIFDANIKWVKEYLYAVNLL